MAGDKKIAFLVASEGSEKAELVEPWQAVLDAGHPPVLISPEDGEVSAVRAPVVDGNLITSRKPDDIPAFNSALLEALTHGVSSAAAAAG